MRDRNLRDHPQDGPDGDDNLPLAYYGVFLLGLSAAGATSVYLIGQGPPSAALPALMWMARVLAPLYVFAIGIYLVERYMFQEPDGDAS